MLGVRIAGTCAVLSGRRRATDEIAADIGRDPVELARLSGVDARYWADDDTSVTDMAVQAVRGAADAAGLALTDLERVVFVCSTGGDVLIPANVNSVIHALGLSGRAHGVDVNNACVGFLSGVDLAARSVATGVGPTVVVAVEQLSPFVTPEYPRPYAVLADAAAATVFVPPRGDEGVLGTYFGNDGAYRESVSLAHSGLSGQPEHIRFGASNRQLRAAAVEALTRSASMVLESTSLTFDDIDWFLPHQPNGNMLRVIVDGMGIPADRIVPIVQEIGSVGSVAIPYSLDRLLRTREIAAGQHLLMLGVGAGMAYGAVLYRAGVS